MAIIKKEVTGMADELKLVSNGKSAPKSPAGGTSRTAFAGSNDTRSTGTVNSNKLLKAAEGYINQGPENIGDTSHSRSFTKAGNRGSTTAAFSAAKEDVTKGMGGKFIKD